MDNGKRSLPIYSKYLQISTRPLQWTNLKNKLSVTFSFYIWLKHKENTYTKAENKTKQKKTRSSRTSSNNFFCVVTVNDKHSMHWGINRPPQNYHPLFLAKPPPPESANCSSPSFLGISPPIYWLNLGFFHEPQNIKVFHPSPHLIF